MEIWFGELFDTRRLWLVEWILDKLQTDLKRTLVSAHHAMPQTGKFVEKTIVRFL